MRSHRVLRYGFLIAFFATVTRAWTETNQDQAHNNTRALIAQDTTTNAAGASGKKFHIQNFVSKPIDGACYRRSLTPPTETCPQGYAFGKVFTSKCWAECPIEYPIQCGLECLSQDRTCLDEAKSKGEALANVALNTLSGGVYGVIKEGLDTALFVKSCVESIEPILEGIGKLVDASKAKKDVKAEVLTKFGTEDLPNALSACFNIDVKAMIAKEKEALVKAVAGAAVDLIVSKKPRDKDSILAMLNKAFFKKDVSAKASRQLRTARVEFQRESSRALTQRRELSSFNTTRSLMQEGGVYECGKNLKTVLETMAKKIETLGSSKSEPDAIRATLAASEVFLKDLPEVIMNCIGLKMPKLYSQALNIIYAFVDKLIDEFTKQKLTTGEKAVVVADATLAVVAQFDSTQLAKLASEFIQPVCGPTVFTRNIDFGDASEALGLNSDGWAFEGSSGEWLEGSPLVSIAFWNSDTLDETVYIMSAGTTVATVKVAAGNQARWESTTLEPSVSLQGKTLYIMRERVKTFARDDASGGSLVLWVPKNPGQIHLVAKISPPPEPKK